MQAPVYSQLLCLPICDRLKILTKGAELGASRATLEVRVSNEPARRLYEKYGFEIVSRRKRYYANNDEDTYIMATPLFDSLGFQTNLHSCRRGLHVRLRQDQNEGEKG